MADPRTKAIVESHGGSVEKVIGDAVTPPRSSRDGVRGGG
jgi:class 3 adenylate cyclase